MNPNEIIAQEKQLKQQSFLLSIGCNIALLTGFFTITLAPFLTTNKILRITCLGGSFLLGCTTVIASNELYTIEKMRKAISKAVGENFGLDLATKQILIEDDYKSRLMPPMPPMENIPEQQYYPNENLPLPEAEIVEENSNKLTITQSDYDAVLMAIEQGKPDSYIIQDILNCKGRNYQKGKAILTEIKQME